MRIAFYFTFFLTFSAQAYALDKDDTLKLISETYGLSYTGCQVNTDLIDSSLIEIGDIVFNTTVLSGDSDTSCSTCHLDSSHLTDGLPISVGVGGVGEGRSRMNSSGVLVPRNAFTLFGRASSNFDSFFWDGKVQLADGKIYSPIGEGHGLGFTSALAVAAVQPLIARDEFLGTQSFFSSSKHFVKINKEYFGPRLNALNSIIKEILQEKKGEALRSALEKAKINEPSISVIGNALASFIANKVSNCNESPWQKYLSGDLNAITQKQKDGAILFFGKGRCAACHNGDLFSDFNFYSIGVPQSGFGPHIHGQDIGRASVTYKEKDRFKFRTPPLIGVSMTAPYGHNGTFETLDEVVLFHINPIPYFLKNGWTSERELLTYGKILGQRSQLLSYIEISKNDELDSLIEFLKSL